MKEYALYLSIFTLFLLTYLTLYRSRFHRVTRLSTALPEFNGAEAGGVMPTLVCGHTLLVALDARPTTYIIIKTITHIQSGKMAGRM